jgi:hypothetical protein
MGFVERNAQDKPSMRVILFDEPGLRNWNGKRMQLGDGAMASDVRDAEARLDASTVIVAPGDPGAHRDTGTAATEQCEEPERGRPLVVIGDPRYQVDPSLSGAGQPRHARHDLRELVDAEFHSLDLS